MNGIRDSVRNLPTADMLLGYGSGVFTQCGISYGKSIVDVLAIVKNKELYFESLVNRGWISSSSYWAAHFSNPEITYFANIPISSSTSIKLGVIDSEKCFSRLNDWGSSFYIPGRLQKPIKIISPFPDPVLRDRFVFAQYLNRRRALVAAVLALPPECRHSFTLPVLYASLVGLSYMGDIRVGVAENPNKVSNIVSAQLDLFHGIYDEHLSFAGIVGSNSGYECIFSGDQLWSLLSPDFTKQSIHLIDRRASLLATLRKINARESLHQAIVGVGTTGITRSGVYLLEKLKKRVGYIS